MSRINRTVAGMSLIVGLLLCAGGLIVLVLLRDSLSTAEARLLIGLNLLMFGLFFLQISDRQQLRDKIESLREQSESDNRSRH